jgi:hypothetical protein
MQAANQSQQGPTITTYGLVVLVMEHETIQLNAIKINTERFLPRAGTCNHDEYCY